VRNRPAEGPRVPTSLAGRRVRRSLSARRTACHDGEGAGGSPRPPGPPDGDRRGSGHGADARSGSIPPETGWPGATVPETDTGGQARNGLRRMTEHDLRNSAKSPRTFARRGARGRRVPSRRKSGGATVYQKPNSPPNRQDEVWGVTPAQYPSPEEGGGSPRLKAGQTAAVTLTVLSKRSTLANEYGRRMRGATTLPLSWVVGH